MLRSIGLQELLILVFIVVCLVVPQWKIFSKAGYSGALSLAMLVPFVNVIVLWFVAFSDWPVLKELRALRQKPGGAIDPATR